MENRALKAIKDRGWVVALLPAAVTFLIPSCPRAVPIALVSLSLILLVWHTMGAYSYAKGAREIRLVTRSGYASAMSHFEKALERGIDDASALVAATLLLQYGDMEKGKLYLEGLLGAKDGKTRNGALVSLSMYHWIHHDLDKAIGLCREAEENGYRDRNLSINLATYYLEKGDWETYRKVAEDAGDRGFNLPALKDAEALYQILQGRWDEADAILNDLFASSTPSYLDPYLHRAMTELHYGEWGRAVSELGKISKECAETNTAIYSFSEIDTLISLLEDENTRWGLRSAMEEDPAVFLRREMPARREGVEKPAAFPPRNGDKAEEKNEEEDESMLSDERDIDTSLTDDDEEWIRRHS